LLNTFRRDRADGMKEEGKKHKVEREMIGKRKKKLVNDSGN
jgi:hypothetical protein